MGIYARYGRLGEESGSAQHTSESTSRLAAVLLLALIAIGYFESIVGWLQLGGLVDSGNIRYRITGTYSNPGPYACLLAIIMPVSLWRSISKDYKALSCLAKCQFLISAPLIAISFSRAAWLGGIFGCGIVLFKTYGIKQHAIVKRWLPALVLTILAIFAAIILLRPASVLGRILVYRCAIMGVALHPVSGVGWPFVGGVLGEMQELYFLMHADSQFVKYASAPEYIFNDFLQIGLAYGLPVLIAIIGLLVFCFKIAIEDKDWGICGSLAAFVVTSLFTYNLSSSLTVVCVGLLTCATFLSGYRAKKNTRVIAVMVCMCCCTFQVKANIKKHEPRLNGTYLFEKGKFYRQRGDYLKSNDYLCRGCLVSSDPMFLNLIGLNYQDLKDYDNAKSFFEKSVLRVPNRLYPRYLLVKLMAANRDVFDNDAVSRSCKTALELQPKIMNTQVRVMQEEIRLIYNSIENENMVEN